MTRIQLEEKTELGYVLSSWLDPNVSQDMGAFPDD